jgi:hypothetical protein
LNGKPQKNLGVQEHAETATGFSAQAIEAANRNLLRVQKQSGPAATGVVPDVAGPENFYRSKFDGSSKI